MDFAKTRRLVLRFAISAELEPSQSRKSGISKRTIWFTLDLFLPYPFRRATSEIQMINPQDLNASVLFSTATGRKFLRPI